MLNPDQEGDLWYLLGVESNATIEEIDSAYRALDPEKQQASDIRFAWKLLRDPYFSSAYRTLGSREKMIAAGFFDDGGSIHEPENLRKSPRWLVTPFHKIKADKISENSVILLTTGGFSPIHQSHIEMLEIAHREMTSRGKNIVGAYISPSHDQYVSSKPHAALTAIERIRLCDEAVMDHEWIMVDGWEALHNDRSLNFTDIIERLKLYLEKYFPALNAAEIVYVFGSDNAGFSMAFLEKGHAVCVMRPGYENLFNLYKNESLNRSNPRMIFAESSTASPGLSSSEIRMGNESRTLSAVTRKLDEWGALKNATFPLVYALRDEGFSIVESWAEGRDRGLLRELKDQFLSELEEVFIREWASFGSLARFVKLSAANQQSILRERFPDQKFISLDAFIPVDYQIQVSRSFGLSAGKSAPVLVPRPGYSNLGEQISAIPEGNYILVDDDIASGFTMDAIQQLLPKLIKIEQIVSLVNLEMQSPYDILDLRDFLLGSKDSGLVVSLAKSVYARAPYLFPYVALSDRAKVLPEMEISLSRRIWILNRAFFAQMDPPICLSDCDFSFQKLMNLVGFKDHTPLTELIDWHLERLSTAKCGFDIGAEPWLV